jgi:hypothetical protein
MVHVWMRKNMNLHYFISVYTLLMMTLYKIMRRAEQPPRADYYLSPGEAAAVGAINRPLQAVWVLHIPTDVQVILFICIISGELFWLARTEIA